MRVLAAALLIVASVSLTGAQTLICFGNEPSWSFTFNSPDRGVLAFLTGTPREFHGRETRNDFIKESVWRGSSIPGGPEVVLFLREAPCSDGMSDTMHPMYARASLPDGSFLVGCCRIPGGTGEAAPLGGLAWRLVSLPGQSASTLAALQRPVSIQFDSGRVSGFNGCNTMAGSYTLNGNQLTLGTLAGTAMACQGPASTVESAFNRAFAGTLTYAITGNRLNLTNASHYVLSFEREAVGALTGRTWNVTGYNNGRQGVVSPIANSAITLSFANGRVSGRAGCNSFTGSYTQSGNGIKIGTLALTRMMCAQDVMAQERDFLRALESAVRWNVQGDRLDMHRADGERALEATPDAGATLTGRAWSVSGFNNGRGGVVSTILNTPITLSFADGRVSGQTGCNTFNGSYTQNGNRIQIGTMAVTNMMCAENVMTQEREFLRALESAVRWEVQGDRLDMHRADGERALEATPEAAGTLNGRAWNVTGFNNGRQGVVSAIVGSPISLSFAGGTVSGRAGCNTFTGSYTLQGNTIRVGQLANTNMMCVENGVMDQEREFLQALQSAVRWEVQGDRLDMHRADGERALEATPSAAGALTGRTWTITGINNGLDAVASPISGTRLSLTFSGNGRVTGNAGCNTYSGSFTQQGESVRIGSITTTGRRCPTNVLTQERDFLRALRSAASWSVQGDQMQLHRTDGQTALTASSGPVN